MKVGDLVFVKSANYQGMAMVLESSLTSRPPANANEINPKRPHMSVFSSKGPAVWLKRRTMLQKHSDYCVLQFGYRSLRCKNGFQITYPDDYNQPEPLEDEWFLLQNHKAIRIVCPKRWVFDLEEEDHYAKPFGAIWDLSQRFETKEAKEEWQQHRIQSLQKLKSLDLLHREIPEAKMTIGDWIKDILLSLLGIVLYVGLLIAMLAFVALFCSGPLSFWLWLMLLS
jgi:hypothetical protein